MEWVILKGWGGVFAVNKYGEVKTLEHEVKCFNGTRTIYEKVKKYTRVKGKSDVITLTYKKKHKTYTRYRMIRAYYNGGVIK